MGKTRRKNMLAKYSIRADYIVRALDFIVDKGGNRSSWVEKKPQQILAEVARLQAEGNGKVQIGPNGKNEPFVHALKLHKDSEQEGNRNESSRNPQIGTSGKGVPGVQGSKQQIATDLEGNRNGDIRNPQIKLQEAKGLDENPSGSILKKEKVDCESSSDESDGDGDSLASETQGTEYTDESLEESVRSEKALPSKELCSDGERDGQQMELKKNFFLKGNNSAPRVDLSAGNRNLQKCGAVPCFSSDGTGAHIEAEDIEDGHWENCLIGYFSGKFPGKAAVNSVVGTWNAKFEIIYHDSGYIIFNFSEVEDLIEVLQEGPYFANGRPLLLKTMPYMFQFNVEDMSVVPVWVQLKNLPLELWTLKALGRICSVLGRPLVADKLTVNGERVSYARVLVEIDVAEDIKGSVEIWLPNGIHGIT
ncbi:uncharacterized protein LOC131164659 isoform X2 [Malania oleifera]|uniref:uncharacterized protein LOC131164659 isoform X2 n=1 Tax=Malania oleifera TaxID=397392 RepID=UPI0025ADF66C|nr:uncharacterized protein LOC131164659 isoform X2 [Malania oleifera]